ncbi:MAG: ribonuclease Y [candidate division WOR-3 bacterium]|nr:ribonuclease Y [candidate division WOR-3 bacterium]MDH5683969.1 ribonuclease Y [candidate division WOR-3 bacterium]
MTINAIVIFLTSGIIGVFVGLLVSHRIAKSRLKNVNAQIKRIIEEAKADAENQKQKAEIKIKEEWFRERTKFEDETNGRRKELEKLEKKVSERELVLNNKENVLTHRESDLLRRERELLSREKVVRAKAERYDQLINVENEKLVKIANLSIEDAKKELLKNLENQAHLEAAQMVKEIKETAKAEAETQAKEVLMQSIQRCAISHAAETTVSVVNLPSDELKGRIIGREGRNILTFESLTGVEVVIDDTPRAIVISGFDPIRREIAKLAMEKLVSDGRIHPTRIEEVVAKTTEEMDNIIKSAGETSVLELGIVGVPPELIKHLGRLKYRTSYGQNVLLHSKEVALLAALMAQELGFEPAIARRAGLLHDIGKSADHSLEGTHAQLGAEIAQRYGENDLIINAIAAHHEEIPFETPYAFMVAAADSISGSRPGARHESFEAYIKRIEKLEEIAASFPGVDKAYAIQAGREVRVLVEPEKITDIDALDLATKIAAQIQLELKYSGQIKVTVVRETRAVNYAR